MEFFLYCQDFHDMASFKLVSTATTRVRTKKNKEKFRCKHKNVGENLIDKRHGSRIWKITIYPTEKFTSMNLFKILWVVTWA